ncbi:MAG TPA: MATE family efflux transporter, partial [Sarcina sp.]|nr:MATE family efflux transporter [Sarcina sp.]
MNQKELKQYEKLVLTPVERLIPSLAVPTVISMMVTMIYNLVDAFFVGKLGTSASAAIGIVLGVQSIIQAFGFMLGHGSG